MKNQARGSRGRSDRQPATTIEIRLGDEDLERIAARLVELIRETQPTPSQWVDVAGAGAHLGLTDHAIRGLVKHQRIPFHRTENRRLRFSVTELDHWVRSGSCGPTDEDLP